METPVSMNAGKRQMRRRRSRSEWCDLIARFQASGQTRDAFCRRHAIALSTFDRWRRLLQGDTPVVSTEAPDKLFIELTETVPEPQRPAPWDVELQLGEGVYLRLRCAPC